ncbi:GIP [Symbiodinium pilosum]|uniref:GIP protein n=1 Tax=Symbiodinium pilosum TaxID=2952 RepID=A0A812ULC9_SYMPI|nr:GIP [Symbiodinium pilosum]
MNDRIFTAQSELRFMASDNRSQQKHQSGLMLAAAFLINRRFLDANFDHTALTAEVCFNVLSVEPTTIPQGKDFFSPMTMSSRCGRVTTKLVDELAASPCCGVVVGVEPSASCGVVRDDEATGVGALRLRRLCSSKNSWVCAA